MSNNGTKKTARSICQWFLMCKNTATMTRPHPTLGEVPICAGCNKKMDALGAPAPAPKYLCIPCDSARVHFAHDVTATTGEPARCPGRSPAESYGSRS